MNTGVVHEFIMPALGMTQDSGDIVAWHKSVGDAVMLDDILVEVETDKSTMEIEAGHSGYVHEIRVGAGNTVAVGEVIAVLGDAPLDGLAKPTSESLSTASQAKARPDTQEVTVDRAVRETVAAATTSITESHSNTGIVLASPKARLAAHENGVSLTRLVRQGVELPLQMADIEAAVTAPSESSTGRSQLQARVPALQFEAFVDWVSEVSDGARSAAAVWCLFGTASLRQALALGKDNDLTVRCESWGDRERDLACLNADVGGLLDVHATEHNNEASLVIRDMTGTTLVGYQPAVHGVEISLTVVDVGDGLLLFTLGFDEQELELNQAMVFLQCLGQRVEQPLRHLL